MAIYKQEKRVWETGEVFVSIDLGRDGYSLTQSQIMKIHSRLTRMTSNLCHTFSLQIGCEIVNFFIGLVINIFFLVNFSTKKVTFTNPQFVFTKLLNSYWAVFFLCKLWFIIYNFVATQKKGNWPVEFIQKLMNRTNDDRLKIQLHMFLNQLVHDSVKLSILGFLPLDFSIFYRILIATCSYCLIFLQFRIAELLDE
ncbi:unnamed protein product [Bemisia tabaci]|uniref:Gustatory receptor n=1 Tax=Bemisia tabaci TaxID=7038 RepID=A0A9P0AI15_BEMTA|nr:unnamed protein product [Bemisia tabaci]